MEHVVYKCPIDHIGGYTFIYGELHTDPQAIPIILVPDLDQGSVDLSKIVPFSDLDIPLNVYHFDMRKTDDVINKGNRSLAILGSDILQVLAFLHSREAKKPVIIAHKKSAMVVLPLFQIAQINRFIAGVMFVEPTLGTHFPVSSFKRFIINSLSTLMPKLKLSKYLFPKLSQDLELGESRSVSFLKEILLSISQLKKSIKTISVPCFFLRPKPLGFLRRLIHKHHDPSIFTVIDETKNSNIFVTEEDILRDWFKKLPFQCHHHIEMINK